MTIVSLMHREDIPYQYKLPSFGGTDAGAIHLSKGGVLSGVISVPCRYIHLPLRLLQLDDFESTIRLVSEFAKEEQRVLGD